MALRTTQKITLAIGSASILAALVAAIGVYAGQRLLRDARLLSHTHEVRVSLQEISTHLNAAKGDVRGYLITGDSSYFRRHLTNVGETERALNSLADLVADNPSQQRRMAVVRSIVTDREQGFIRTLEVAGDNPRSPAVAERLAAGEKITARLDSVLAAADSEETNLLVVRTRRETTSQNILVIAALTLVATAVALALALRRSIDRDLTGRARAEADLRSSEAKFSGILEVAADGIISVNERQEIVHFNHGAEAIFEYSRAEILGKPLEVLLPKRHEKAHGAHVRGFAGSAETARRMGERRQIHGRRKSGEEFPADASISKLMTPAGLLFTAVIRDVSEQRRREHHEHALAMAGVSLGQTLDYEETLAAVASLPVPSVGAWSVLDIIEPGEKGEPTLRRIAGRHPNAALAGLLHEWETEGVDWDSPEVVIDVLRTAERQRITHVGRDWLEAHLPGPYLVDLAERIGVHSLIIMPLKARDRVIGAWTIGSPAERAFDEYDENLAKALAERASMAVENARLLQRAQRATSARDQVLSIVSHDLRNPLSAVSMFARRLTESPTTDEERHTIGANILSSVEWMHRLMQDLLDVASIEAGKLSVHQEPQSIQGIAEAVEGLFADRAAAQGIQLSSDVPAECRWVYADGSRVVQVLANLVGNALKFTPAGGRIAMTARESGAEMLVSVADTGAGIPADEVPHVFDRFWHAQRNSKVHGHGLGLAIAQGIVRAHGGRIWLESAVGEGSTFYFTLPLVARQTPSLPSAEPPRLASNA